MAAAVVPAATGVPASPFSPGDVVAGVGDTCPGWAGPGATAGAAAASAEDTETTLLVSLRKETRPYWKPGPTGLVFTVPGMEPRVSCLLATQSTLSYT